MRSSSVKSSSHESDTCRTPPPPRFLTGEDRFTILSHTTSSPFLAWGRGGERERGRRLLLPCLTLTGEPPPESLPPLLGTPSNSYGLVFGMAAGGRGRAHVMRVCDEQEEAGQVVSGAPIKHEHDDRPMERLLLRGLDRRSLTFGGDNGPRRFDRRCRQSSTPLG